MPDANLTDRQSKWFASVRDGLERDTGRSMAQWVEIALDCPETAHRARLKWFKDHHGLLQNRASLVIRETFGDSMGWREPEAQIEALWVDSGSRAIFEALAGHLSPRPDVVRTARKTYTAWSRKVQFAAARPVKGSTVMLGLAVPPDVSARLTPRGHESWSERLTARVALASPMEVDADVLTWLERAIAGA